jgi:curved DNA-binding protein CbpA
MEIVQTSYRTIMQKLKAHPDLGGDTWNAAVINEAYDILSDPDRRARYDSILFAEKDMEMLTVQSQAQRYKDI